MLNSLSAYAWPSKKLYDITYIGGGGGAEEVSPTEPIHPLSQAILLRDGWIIFQILTFTFP